MKRMTNDEKIKNVQLRKALKVFIIIFCVLTIVLSILSLWKNVTPFFAIVCFVIEVVLHKYREKLDPKEQAIKKK